MTGAEGDADRPVTAAASGEEQGELTATVLGVAAAGSMLLFHAVRVSGFEIREVATAAIDLESAGLIGFVLCFGWACRRLLGVARWPLPEWTVSQGLLFVVGLGVVCAAGLWAGAGGPNLGPLLSLGGFVLLALAGVRFLRTGSCGSTLVFAAAALWPATRGIFYVLRNSEEVLVRGYLHRDVLYHAALASMIGTHGFPSTGVNGTPYYPYHFGSHWVVAQFAHLLRIDALRAYEVAGRPLFTGFLLAGLVTLVAALRDRLYPDARRPWRTDLVLFGTLWLMLVGVDAVAGLPGLGIPIIRSESNILGSESFTLALGLAVATASALLRAHPRQASAGENAALACLLIPGLVAVVGLSKISLMPVFLAVFGYVAARMGLLCRLPFLVGAALSTGVGLAALLATRPNVANPGQLAYQLVPAFLHNQLRDPLAQTVWMLPYLFWTGAFLLVRLARPPLTLKELWNAVRRRETLDMEAALILCAVSFAPPLFMHTAGGGAVYFSNIAIVGGACFFAAACPSPGLARAGAPWRDAPALALLAVPALVVAALAAALPAREQWQLIMLAGQSARSALTPGAIPKRQRSHLPVLRPYRKRIGMIEALHELRALPIREKRETLLYVPRANHVYWGLDPNTDASQWPSCLCRPFIAPAITGMAMLEGFPERPCADVNPHAYGMAEPVPMRLLENGVAPGTEPGRELLCAHAMALGFAKVLVLAVDERDRPAVTRHDCP